MSKPWAGRAATDARAWCMKFLGWDCGLCGTRIEDPDDYTVGHILDRATHPGLTWVRSNWQPEHGRKHPELNCPGNFGKSRRKAAFIGSWTAPGW